MADVVRESVITVRVSPEERNMVERMAGEDGISISDAVRMAVRRAYAERFGAPKAKGKR